MCDTLSLGQRELSKPRLVIVKHRLTQSLAFGHGLQRTVRARQKDRNRAACQAVSPSAVFSLSTLAVLPIYTMLVFFAKQQTVSLNVKHLHARQSFVTLIR